MTRYSLTDLPDHELLRDLNRLVRQDRTTTAELLAHLAEVDERKLFLPAAYPSMAAWCVGELRLSEGAAFRRIRAARTARQFPAIFPALADGQLNLAAVLLLAPHLAPGNADELLAASSGLARPALEKLLAERFPRPDLEPAVLDRSAASSAGSAAQVVAELESQLSPATVGMTGVEHLEGRSRVAPLSPQRFGVQFTMDEAAHEDLLYAQALLGHTPDGADIAGVFARSLKALVRELERGKFAKCARRESETHGRRATKAGSRHIPAHVRRAVWRRDGGRCTFVGTNGHRCEATSRLEYDHVTAFARGGEATVDGIRLVCRAHNQYEAEQTFGRAFMEGKREGAKQRAADAPAAPAPSPQPDPPPGPERESVVPCLRALRCPAGEAKRLAGIADALLPDGTLEERLRLALKHGRQVGVKHVPAPATAPQPFVPAPPLAASA